MPEKWRTSWDRRYREILEQSVWIDKDLQHINGIYTTEHHFYGDGYLPSPMAANAAIAARTDRVKIGSNLIQIPLHNAVRLAEDALVVDAISGGRLQLGIGMGYYHQEFTGLGRELKNRVSLTEEGIAILRAAFTGEPFSFHGKRYDFDDLHITPGPIREGGPEIWMGGFAPAAIDRVARLADGFLEFDAGTRSRYFQACDALGKPREQQRVNSTYWAIIAEDPEKAFAEAGEYWMHLLNEYIVRDAYTARTPPLRDPFTDPREALAEGLVFLADADGAIKKFNADISNGTIDIHLVTTMPGEPIDQVNERLQYLNDKVIPRLEPVCHPSAADRTVN
nr:LLM class flavin-dependent oxidoreductase [Leucobacter weissii]